MKQGQQEIMSKSAADMTVEEFAIYLMIKWDDLIHMKVPNKHDKMFKKNNSGSYGVKANSLTMKRR